MGDPGFGRIERLSPRPYWPDESRDFTPWLAEPEQIALLGEAIGVALEVEGIERAVGPFSADLVCRIAGADGDRVVVENQLTRTDHDHLGKMLTYAAGLPDVRTVVWIAPEFREEHRAAIDWLNDVTGHGTAFFAVQVEVWRIGDSLPAPRFDVVARPNEWVHAMRDVASGQLTPLQQVQLAFWTAFHEHLRDRGGPLVLRTPRPSHAVTLATFLPGARLNAVAGTWDEEAGATVAGSNRVEIVLDGPRAQELFDALHDQREAIVGELATGETPLTWRHPEGVTMRRIHVKRAFDIRDRGSWPAQFAWLEEWLTRFDAVFRPRLGRLASPGEREG